MWARCSNGSKAAEKKSRLSSDLAACPICHTSFTAYGNGRRSAALGAGRTSLPPRGNPERAARLDALWLDASPRCCRVRSSNVSCRWHPPSTGLASRRGSRRTSRLVACGAALVFGLLHRRGTRHQAHAPSMVVRRDHYRHWLGRWQHTRRLGVELAPRENSFGVGVVTPRYGRDRRTRRRCSCNNLPLQLPQTRLSSDTLTGAHDRLKRHFILHSRKNSNPHAHGR